MQRPLSLSVLPGFTRPLYRQSWVYTRTCLAARAHPRLYSVSPRASLGTGTRSSISTERLRTSLLSRVLCNTRAYATHRSVGRTSGGSSGQGGSFWQRLRSRINSIPNNVIFWGIIGLNGAVFAAWNLAWIKYRSTGDGSSVIWMRKNFVTGWHNMQAGRYWTLLTSAFSHEDLTHILFNGFTFYFMAPAVLAVLGNVGFLGLYFGGGIASSLASLGWRSYHPGVGVQNGAPAGSHGASGAIYSVVSFFACMAPTTTFYFFGVVPLPAWALVTGVFIYDGYSAMQDWRLRTDTAGHIGGLLAGMGYYAGKRLRIF